MHIYIYIYIGVYIYIYINGYGYMYLHTCVSMYFCIVLSNQNGMMIVMEGFNLLRIVSSRIGTLATHVVIQPADVGRSLVNSSVHQP